MYFINIHHELFSTITYTTCFNSNFSGFNHGINIYCSRDASGLPGFSSPTSLDDNSNAQIPASSNPNFPRPIPPPQSAPPSVLPSPPNNSPQGPQTISSDPHGSTIQPFIPSLPDWSFLDEASLGDGIPGFTPLVP